MEEERSFGRWIKQRRKELDLTQEALAQEVGCSIETIRKVERDALRPSRQIAERLADQLAIAPDERAAFVRLARAADQPPAAPEPPGAAWAPAQPRRPLTSLVGRAATLAALKELLAGDVRLLTLTGPPGVGKTRLSLQLAAELGPALADGACFVPLVALSDATGVADAVLRALGVSRSNQRSASDTLFQTLGGRQMLLVLDNFEQLLPAAPLVAELLKASPLVRVIATSRVPLRLAGEQEYAVPPLPLPWTLSADAPAAALGDAQTAGLVPSTDAIARSPAVALFVQRAQAARADFALTEDNALTVATICARLDGLPLAIELAAARIKLFTPQALLRRLDRRLALLADGARDLPPHQRTLRAAIDWSYRLLDADQQALLASLSVFAGGCSLPAAQAVCADTPDPGLPFDTLTNRRDEGKAQWALLNALGSLIDHSLVYQDEDADGEPRFMLLEMIREYGDERLAASGRHTATHQRHVGYFLARAESGDVLRGGAEQAHWHDWLEREHDNIRAALAWCVRDKETRRQGDKDALYPDAATTVLVHAVSASPPLARSPAEVGLRLGWALHRFWEARGHVGEGQSWLEALLALPESAATGQPYALALDAAGFLAWVSGDHAAAQHHFARSAEAGRAHGHSAGSAHAIYALGYAQAQSGAHAQATPLLHEALEVAQSLGAQQIVGSALTQLAASAAAQGDTQLAARTYQQAMQTWHELGNKQGLAMVLGQLGAVAWRAGDTRQAERLYADALATWTELGNAWGIAHVLHALAWVALRAGEPDRAAVYLAEALERFVTYEHRQGSIACARLAGLLAIETGHLREGARLVAAAQALGPAAALEIDDAARCEQAVASAQARLEPAEYATASGEGAALTLGEATARALAVLRSLAP